MAATDEAVVAAVLLDYLLARPEVVVHTWHPPSGKAYFGPLIRIPRRVPGAPTRDRYHLDGIVQVEHLLLLVELKGASGDLASDELKLAELMATYDIDALKSIMLPRVREKSVLATATSWAPAFGYRLQLGPAPSRGVVLHVPGAGGPVKAVIGSGLARSEAAKLESLFSNSTP